MVDLFGAGLVLGLAAGISPGPLLTLVILESLRGGLAAGVRVAFAPLVTDLSIVVATLWLLGGIGRNPILLGLIALLGGCYLLWLAWEGFSGPDLSAPFPSAPSASLWKGVLANFLSPHPYLFWALVGGPLMAAAWPRHGWGVTAFAAGFYLLLVGSKVAVAVLVGRSRSHLPASLFRGANRLLAFLLLVFALILFRDGWRFLALSF